MSILIEESNTEKVPPILTEIITSLLRHNKSADSLQKDFIFGVIIVVMLENGYCPVNDSFEAVSLDSKQFEKWKTVNGLFEATLVLTGFEKIPLKVIMSPLGSTAIVNMVIRDMNCETYGVCLPVSRYVVSPQASTIPMIFRDLRHLSLTLKNKLLTPVKSRVLNQYGYPSASLLGLPEEVLQKIILYLSIADIGRMSKVCLRFKYLLDNESLWHELFKRDFPETPSLTNCSMSSQENTSSLTNWKTKYKELKDKSARQANKSSLLMNSFTDVTSEFLPFIHPEWSNMIM